MIGCFGKPLVVRSHGGTQNRMAKSSSSCSHPIWIDISNFTITFPNHPSSSIHLGFPMGFPILEPQAPDITRRSRCLLLGGWHFLLDEVGDHGFQQRGAHLGGQGNMGNNMGYSKKRSIKNDFRICLSYFELFWSEFSFDMFWLTGII